MTGTSFAIPTRGDALVLRHRLAERGIAVGLRDGALYANPADLLTDRDRNALREHAGALRSLLAEPGLDPLREQIAGRRRALVDDAGYPVCPCCAARTRADGARTCPAGCTPAEQDRALRGGGAERGASQPGLGREPSALLRDVA